MKLFYDLHIHSALSPCGDMDMTPNNIVNMSIIKGLDIIAVSDHNSIGNAEAVISAAKGKDLLVVPAMEVETSEEVHILCLFPDISSAEKMADAVKKSLSGIKNKPEIFGRQTFMNDMDEITGEEENLLVSATSLSIDDVKRLAESVGGVAVPAHVDRNSYSVLSNLGMLPEIGFNTIEVSKNNNPENFRYLNKKILQNSDAHYLGDISEPENFIELPEKTTEALLMWIKGY